MLQIKILSIPDYERVIEVKDPEAGLHGYISVHNSSLGPSLGGIRMFPYQSSGEALQDALRLSKAMSYKSALAETGLGGGKSVIIGNSKQDKTEALLLSFAEAINTLKGLYIAAEDVGTTAADLLILSKKTPYLAALPLPNSSGDPSRFTAYGILQGLRAVAQTLWGSPLLRNKSIAIQGLGNVGAKLAHFLFWEGANLILADLDQETVEQECQKLGAQAVSPEEILEVPCDIFAPCAMGAILNSKSIPKLKCSAVAGAANNQLKDPSDGELLMQRGILYAPDYAVNAGGILNAASEFDSPGYDPRTARDKIMHIFDTLMTIFHRSQQEHIPPHQIADELALFKLTHGIGKRKLPLIKNS